MAILEEMIHSLSYSKPCCFFFNLYTGFCTTVSYGCFPLFCLGLFVQIGLLANVMHHFCRTERAAHDQAVGPWREESAQPETALSLSELMCSICGLTKLGPVVRKPINAISQINSLRRSLFLYSQMLFNADIRQKFTLEEVNLEKQK